MAVSLPPAREPDSTYFDLSQPSQGNTEAVGGAEAGMDVFQLQDVSSPVMVSGPGGGFMLGLAVDVACGESLCCEYGEASEVTILGGVFQVSLAFGF